MNLAGNLELFLNYFYEAKSKVMSLVLSGDYPLRHNRRHPELVEG